ncbi:uncharacterized protein A4U43_C04F13380 [Asparagus officinalis]|uniref:Nucleotide-diphospho-sugar transferase domain-containing protein n=1 Tax=Asparagus officinalis TaxID=4686 RepID=A0A5P1F0K4_ASPOF|nr:uncharacterized protein A4U43_C04F13380 [Asparagus officinalis]
MDDRTVIITVLNEAWALPGSIFDLFLESFHIGEQTEKLLNHLVVVARDPKAFRRCKLIHKYCFLVQTQATDFSGEKSHDYLKFRSLELLTSVLDLGYNFIYTDTDIMWLRNPISHFSNEAQITIASDYFCGNSSDQRNQAICGFLYVKSNGQTIEFFKYWIMSRTVYPNKNEQQIFNIIKQDGYATRLALEERVEGSGEREEERRERVQKKREVKDNQEDAGLKLGVGGAMRKREWERGTWSESEEEDVEGVRKRKGD